MPPGVAERIKKLGGLLPALASVLPGLASAARVERGSTSAGLYRTDTGAKLAGSSGLHLFVGVPGSSESARHPSRLAKSSATLSFGAVASSALATLKVYLSS